MGRDDIRIPAEMFEELKNWPIPKGAIPQEVAIEKSGTIVVYGIPNEEHNCDEMGCPTLEHVLYVKHIVSPTNGEGE